MARRDEHIAMGRFVAHLSDETLRAVFAVLTEEDLLRIAFTLEEKERLDHVTRLLPDKRMGGVLEAASADGLWAEALDLIDHLSPDRRAEIATIAVDLPDHVLDSLIEVAEREDLWAELLPLATAQPELLEQLVEPARRLAPAVRAGILADAERLGMAGALGPLLAVLASA